MRCIHEVCCGLDVHKRMVTACLLIMGAIGKVATKEIRTFPTVLARSSSGIAEPVFVLDPRQLETRSYNDFDLSGG